MRKCRICGTSQGETEFYGDKTARDGLRSAYKACTRAARKSYCAENPEKVRACYESWAKSERGRENRRQDSLKRAKTERGRENRRRWSMTTKGRECRRERVRRFDHTEKGAAARRRRNAARRAREQLLINDLTAAQWSAIMDLHNNKCAYCGVTFTADLPATIDHVMPISKGGQHTAANVVPACRPCNSRKRDRIG